MFSKSKNKNTFLFFLLEKTLKFDLPELFLQKEVISVYNIFCYSEHIQKDSLSSSFSVFVREKSRLTYRVKFSKG